MPFISREESAAIRKELKKAFPKPWKFSVRIEHHTSLDVVIKEGPIKFNCRDGYQVNQWRLNDFTGEEKQALEKVFAIIDQVKPKREVSYDGDYGSIPNYYLHVSIGDWSKPYKQVLDQKGILQKLMESKVNVVGSLTNIVLDNDFYLRLAGIFTDKGYLVKDADLKLAMGKYCIAQNEVRKGSEETSKEQWTKKQAIKALEAAKAEAKPNGWGNEDDGYWEYMAELQGTIDDIKEGAKSVKEALDYISFNPQRYLKGA